MAAHDLIIPTTEAMNHRALYEYYYTPDAIPNLRAKQWKHNCPIPLMYFTLHQMAVKARNKDIAGGKYLCHECTSESGSPVYHNNTSYFAQFREKYGKFFPTLHTLQKEYL